MLVHWYLAAGIACVACSLLGYFDTLQLAVGTASDCKCTPRLLAARSNMRLAIGGCAHNIWPAACFAWGVYMCFRSSKKAELNDQEVPRPSQGCCTERMEYGLKLGNTVGGTLVTPRSMFCCKVLLLITWGNRGFTSQLLIQWQFTSGVAWDWRHVVACRCLGGTQVTRAMTRTSFGILLRPA